MPQDTIAIAELVPHPLNARQHPEEQLRQLTASILRLGFIDPIEVDEGNVILSGHGRRLAAIRAGLTHVPIVRVTGLSDGDKRAYVLAANRIAENAAWDMEKLAQETAALAQIDVPLIDLGFSQKELNELVYSLTRKDVDAAPAPDEAPSPTEAVTAAVTQAGDIWLLGEHRLMCGSSTDAAQVTCLMADGMADMIFTDPPYGVSYGGGRALAATAMENRGGGVASKSRKAKAWRAIANDELRADSLAAFLTAAFTAGIAVTKETAPVYVCLPWATITEFKAALTACGIEPENLLVWAKSHVGLGNSHYRPMHELIYYAGRGTWYGDKAQGNVWHLKRDAGSTYVHPTQKPLGLIERALINSSRRGEVILDLFGGSGSTLIACERLGRSARLMELDGRYCDTIIRRWQDATGKTATHEVTGLAFGAA